MENSDVKNLIILGNGFDMHCGLLSSFSNFFNEEFSNDEINIKGLYKSFYEHMFNNAGENDLIRFQHSSIFEMLFRIYTHSSHIDIEYDNTSDDMKAMSKVASDNFWVLYFLFLKPINTDWSDVESQINQFFHKYSILMDRYLQALKPYKNLNIRSKASYINNLDKASKDVFYKVYKIFLSKYIKFASRRIKRMLLNHLIIDF